MSVETESRNEHRGVASGPPVAIGDKVRELPRLGPLPTPSILDRLRASWNPADLVPALDPRQFTAREWRRAGVLALVTHVVLLAAVIVLSQAGVLTTVEIENGRPVFKGWVEELPEVQPEEVAKLEGGGDPGGGDGGEAAGGGGGNTDPTPVTQGTPPPTTPNPIVTPAPPPLVAPSLPVPSSVAGPEIDAPEPARVGLPDAPPAPGEPSMGNTGGDGVGSGRGDGAGRGNDGGVGGGPGGPGGGTRATGTGPEGPGTPAGGGEGPGKFGPPPVQNRPVRLVSPVKPKPTPAMIEANTTGTVTIQVTIGPNGAVLNARPIQRLANGGTEAALEALYRCKFLPAIRNGQYVAETTVVRFDVRSR